jgi:hypothetical protein
MQDILENEDIHLDDMFIASLVFDLIKVKYFNLLEFYIAYVSSEDSECNVANTDISTCSNKQITY